MKNTCPIKLWDWVTYKIRDLCVINLLIIHENNYKIESCCLKCKKKKKTITENIDPEISSTSNGRAMILSKCTICGSKKSRFIKNQEVKALLRKLCIKTPLSKVPILGDTLFWMQFNWNKYL